MYKHSCGLRRSSDTSVSDSMADVVTLTCMTTKQKFEVTNPDVVVLSNGRYAYKEMCPWKGKNGKTLYAFKFCSSAKYKEYLARESDEAQVTKDEQSVPDDKQ